MTSITKHTPGPWEANGSTVVANKASFRALFDCKPLRMTLSAEECAANARLIAAAPELLEALQYQEMADADPEASRRKGYFEEARRLRRNAIAKAMEAKP
jgi:hypothetical protein